VTEAPFIKGKEWEGLFAQYFILEEITLVLVEIMFAVEDNLTLQ